MTAADLHWHDLRTLTLEGQGWTDTRADYDRLPARAAGTVRDPVWNLSQDSAGLCARFQSDATAIHARWSLRKESLAMNREQRRNGQSTVARHKPHKVMTNPDRIMTWSWFKAIAGFAVQT